MVASAFSGGKTENFFSLQQYMRAYIKWKTTKIERKKNLSALNRKTKDIPTQNPVSLFTPPHRLSQYIASPSWKPTLSRWINWAYQLQSAWASNQPTGRPKYLSNISIPSSHNDKQQIEFTREMVRLQNFNKYHVIIPSVLNIMRHSFGDISTITCTIVECSC